MYIISDIPKRLEKWFIRCIYTKLIAELLQQNQDKKFREEERKLEAEQLEKDILREEEKKKLELKLKMEQNVLNPETEGIAGSGMYGAVDVSQAHIQKVLGSANTDISQVPPSSNQAPSTFTPKTQTQFGQMSGAASFQAQQVPNTEILDSTTQTLA